MQSGLDSLTLHDCFYPYSLITHPSPKSCTIHEMWEKAYEKMFWRPFSECLRTYHNTDKSASINRSSKILLDMREALVREYLVS